MTQDSAHGPLRHTSRAWIVLIACGALHAALLFTPWAWPAIDGYPTIERTLDPSYLANDFYTNTSNSYGVDTIQAVLLSALQQATGIHYAAALGFLNLLRCLAFPAVLATFFRALGAGETAALWGVVLGSLSNFALPKTLGWQWVWGDPSTAMFSLLANVAAWTAVLRGRVGMSLVWLALSAAIHPLTCMHGLCLLPLVFLFSYDAEQRWAVIKRPTSWLGLVVFAVAFLGQYFALKAGESDQLPIADYVRIVAAVRHPGDFLVERFSGRDLVAFFTAAAGCALIAARHWRSLPNRRLVAAVTVSYTLIAIAGYVFVSVVPSRFFVQLIPYRMANLIGPFLVFLLGWFAAARIARGDIVNPLLLAGCALLASPIGGRLPLIGAQHATWAAVGVLALAAAEPLFARETLTQQLRAWSQPWLSRGALGALGLLFLTLLAGWGRRREFVIPTATNQHPVYAWLLGETPAGATVLVDQNTSSGAFGAAINPQKVRLVGRRAVVASLDFPFLDKDMRPWEQRWETVFAGRVPDRINHADARLLEQIRSHYPFDYVIRTEPLKTEAPEPGALGSGAGVKLVKEFAAQGGVEPIFVYQFSS